MPTKEDNSDKDKCLELFLKISLDERTARNTIANNKVTANLTAVINEVSTLLTRYFILWNWVSICIIWCESLKFFIYFDSFYIFTWFLGVLRLVLPMDAVGL